MIQPSPEKLYISIWLETLHWDLGWSDLLHGQQMWGHNCCRWQSNKIFHSFRLFTLNQSVLFKTRRRLYMVNKISHSLRSSSHNKCWTPTPKPLMYIFNPAANRVKILKYWWQKITPRVNMCPKFCVISKMANNSFCSLALLFHKG